MGSIQKTLRNYDSSKYYSEHLRPYLKFMLERHRKHGGVTEIRLLLGQAAWSGYFDSRHLDKLIDLLVPVERSKIPYGEHPRIGETNIYVCLHPLNPDLLARSANTFTRSGPGAQDGDVIAYDLVPIDIDPVRPSGISSSREGSLTAMPPANQDAGEPIWYEQRPYRHHGDESRTNPPILWYVNHERFART